MKTQVAYFALLVLAGCSKPQTSDNPVSTEDIGGRPEFSQSKPELRDSLSYVDYVEKFDDNNFFYTDLYFVDGFNYDRYDEITKTKGEVVFTDEETKRTRMEIEHVGQYFNLTGLRNIAIYNKENRKLTTGKLSHIEYVEDLIESKFVAVFQVENPDVAEPLFCIGNSDDELPLMDYMLIEDENLNRALSNYLRLKVDHSNVMHYKTGGETLYSVVSTDTTAYIIETVEKSHRTLYQSKSSEVISRLAIISKEVNGLQILLTYSSVPETDFLFSSVLVFNGQEYEPSRHNRIRKGAL